jgi:hypothetical protein
LECTSPALLGIRASKRGAAGGQDITTLNGLMWWDHPLLRSDPSLGWRRSAASAPVPQQHRQVAWLSGGSTFTLMISSPGTVHLVNLIFQGKLPSLESKQ